MAGGRVPGPSASDGNEYVPGPIVRDVVMLGGGAASPLQAGGAGAGAAHVVVTLNDDSGSAMASVACVLSIAGVETTVTSDAQGRVTSNDKASGAVTIRVADKVVKTSGSGTPQASLAATPTKLTRGDQVTISVTPPAGSAHFKVMDWKCDLTHANPGASEATGTVKRPAKEDAATFDQKWEGKLVAASKITCKFSAGATVRATGDGAVSATVVVLDPQEATLELTPDPRTGTAWKAQLTEDAEGELTSAIATFHDTGVHNWTPGQHNVQVSGKLATGPNRGCRFVESISAPWTSTPKINKSLTDASSAFSKAQDKAYLISVSVKPPDNTLKQSVRVIPREFYDIKGGKPAGDIIIKKEKEDDFVRFALGREQKDNESFSWVDSGHCIQQATLLAGTRRHEYKHDVVSHKANCKKALRALDTCVFGEALVELPGATVDFSKLVGDRQKEIAKAAPTHDIVDEEQTRANHKLEFEPGKVIHGVNKDESGNPQGNVWNPTANKILT